MENYALVTRPAVYSWEAQCRLNAADQGTKQIIVDFTRPVEIVSAYPSIAVAGGDDSLPFPTLDDLNVQLEIDAGSDRRLTSRYDETTLGGASISGVTLGSFRDTLGGARVMKYLLGAADGRPKIGVTFQWKRAVAGGPWFQDVIIGLCFHCNFQGQ